MGTLWALRVPERQAREGRQLRGPGWDVFFSVDCSKVSPLARANTWAPAAMSYDLASPSSRWIPSRRMPSRRSSHSPRLPAAEARHDQPGGDGQL